MRNLPRVDKKGTGDNIKRLMRLKHMSISQMQLEMGMASATNIYAWCRGEVIPSADRLIHLTILLDCTLEDILAIEE